jgi:hypothetical protein
MAQVDAQTAATIAKHGWAVIGVSQRRGGYIGYTLGLAARGLPELYTQALLAGPMSQALNALALAQLTADRPWEAGDVITLGDGRPWAVSAITTERLPMVRRYYGGDRAALRVQQVSSR